jgi:hypothetical protein
MYKLKILTFLLLSCSLFAQQQSSENKKITFSIADSTKKSIEELNSFRLRFHTFRQKFLSDKLSFNEPILPYSTWMLKAGFNSGNSVAPLLQRSDMIRSYKMLYGMDDDLKYLHMILGMAQTATVGVLAYKHIKKYGFFSK